MRILDDIGMELLGSTLAEHVELIIIYTPKDLIVDISGVECLLATGAINRVDM